MNISFKLYKYLKSICVNSDQLERAIKFFKYIPKECVMYGDYDIVMGREIKVSSGEHLPALILAPAEYTLNIYSSQDRISYILRGITGWNEFYTCPITLIEAMKQNPLRLSR